MLQSIKIASIGSYSAEGETLENLKRVNFLFGSNGTGKTTISRVLANPANYPASSVAWTAARPLDTLVYNHDFHSKVFADSTAPGIFTLGAESLEIRTKIDELKQVIDGCNIEITKLQRSRDGSEDQPGKVSELRELRAAVEETCWRYKKSHEGDFSRAFEGLRSNKVKFCDYMLGKHASDPSVLHSLDDLKRRAIQVFDDGLSAISDIPDFKAAGMLEFEQHPILSKIIVGKDDVNIASLILRLENSDWVKQGLQYIQKSDQCPFCQQAISSDLLLQMQEYFDEAYLIDIDALKAISDGYASLGKHIVDRFREIVNAGYMYLNLELFSAEVEQLSNLIELNKRRIEQKLKEPSLKIVLDSSDAAILSLNALLVASRLQIASHNSLFNNVSKEKVELTSSIWQWIVNDAQGSLKTFVSKTENLNKAVAGISVKIDEHRTTLNAAKQNLDQHEALITSVQPTVALINGTLSSFGFSNFHLSAVGEKDELYRVIRTDGSDAAATLSEGERGFIIFLYFYHLVRGSIFQSGVLTDRVVILDDPVSSLDSDVLFIVSTLIRELIEAVRNNGQIKQILVLTHNIYFHKEVSYEGSRGGGACLHDESFWVVRKKLGQTRLIRHFSNPVKTSYELLWAEIKSADRSPITTQNALRRIIENYFKMFGNINFDKIIAHFDGEDRLVCKSLFTWLHDGSHSLSDDLSLSTDDGMIDRYLSVFRDVFEKTDNIGHYDMMMAT